MPSFVTSSGWISGPIRSPSRWQRWSAWRCVAIRVRHFARLPTGAAGPIRDADGVLLVARARHTAAWLDDLTTTCVPYRWRTVAHGDKVYLLPAALTKLAAVDEVRRRTAASRLLAAGYSPLDAEMLAAADAAVTPVDGDLHAQGRQAPHVTVTRRTGLRAGREIARWLLSRTLTRQ